MIVWGEMGKVMATSTFLVFIIHNIMAASMDDDTDLVESDDYYAWLGLGKEVNLTTVVCMHLKYLKYQFHSGLRIDD